MKSPTIYTWLERLLGAVFIIGAVLKAMDMNQFAVQIAAYRVLTDDDAIRIAAWATLLVETFIGVAFLASIRLRGIVHMATIAILTVFTGLIFYAWTYHGLTDCGCFGAWIKMTPPVSIAKNVVMIIMAAVAWVMAALTVVQSQDPLLTPAQRKGRAIAGVLSLCAVIAATAYGVAQSEPPPDAPDPKNVDADRPFAQFVLEADGVHYDLGVGNHIVPMLSATCEHCMATVPDLNNLMILLEGHTVVALMLGKTAEIEEFRLMTAPDFPTIRINDLEFVKHVDIPPRIHLVHDGVSVAHWDEHAPDLDTVLAYED
jgi:hypothetical protein